MKNYSFLLGLAIVGLAVPAYAATIIVPNSSFEDPSRAGLDPAYSSENPNGWTFTSGHTNGVEIITDSRYGTLGGTVGSQLDVLGGLGDQIGYINIGNSGTGTATSDGLTTVEANSVYTLTIAFARRDTDANSPNGSIGLWVADSPVGTFTSYVGNELSTGFTDVTYTWISPASGAEIGGEIQIRMEFEHSGSDWQQAQFDNIRLTVDPIPEPSVSLLAGLGMLALLRRRR